MDAETGAGVARDDAATVTEDSGNTALEVLANDTAPAGAVLQIASVTQPAQGQVTIDRAVVRYTPTRDYCTTGTDRPADAFTYTLATGQTATVRVTIICVDDSPGAVDDAATVTEDDDATRIGVRAKDTDVDGGQNGIASVTQPANGTVVRQVDAVTYRPSANYCNTQQGGAPDAFTYTLAGSNTTTVVINVTCVDDAPVAVNDTAGTTEDAAVDIPVLGNDTDIDGGPKEVAFVSTPGRGSAFISSDKTRITYAPNLNYCNNQTGGTPDTFTYTLNGGSTATVSVVVGCVDDAPVARDASFFNDPVPPGQAFTTTANPGFLQFYTADPDNATSELTITGCDAAGNFTCATREGGSVIVRPDGSWDYTSRNSGLPSGGSDSFDFFVRDPSGLSDSGTITLRQR